MPSGAPPTSRVVVLFDGTCGFCTACADWLIALDRGRRLQILPSQTPGLLDRGGFSQVDADRSVLAFDPGGQRYRGARAVNRCLRELGLAGRFLATIGASRLGARVEDRLYRLIAARRSWLSRLLRVQPACERPASDCEGVVSAP